MKNVLVKLDVINQNITSIAFNLLFRTSDVSIAKTIGKMKLFIIFIFFKSAIDSSNLNIRKIVILFQINRKSYFSYVLTFSKYKFKTNQSE